MSVDKNFRSSSLEHIFRTEKIAHCLHVFIPFFHHEVSHDCWANMMLLKRLQMSNMKKLAHLIYHVAQLHSQMMILNLTRRFLFIKILSSRKSKILLSYIKTQVFFVCTHLVGGYDINRARIIDRTDNLATRYVSQFLFTNFTFFFLLTFSLSFIYFYTRQT